MEGQIKKVRINIQDSQHTQNSDNQRLNQLLDDYQNNKKMNKTLGFSNNNNLTAKQAYLLQNSWRKWLFQKGKGYLVDFDQKQRKKLKDFFNTLDKRKCGSIGINQLQEMLLSLGLDDGFQKVQKLIGNVDGDHSGKIQFEQFLEMIQNQSQENEVVVNFFKQLIFSQMGKSKQKQSVLSKLNFAKTTKPTESQKQILKNNLPFQMIVNQIRRNHILSSMSVGRCKQRGTLKDQNRISKGKFVVKALQKMEQRRIMRQLRQNPSKLQKQTIRN